MADGSKVLDTNSFSRRDLLKLGAAGAAAVALSTYRLDQQVTTGAVINTLVNPDSSVTVEQRKHKLQEVLIKSVSEPKLLGSFLKFMALEVYANTQNYIVAKNTIRQFIYGDGKDLVITKFLAESFRESPEWLDGDFDPFLDSDRKVLQSFSLETIKRSLLKKEDDPGNTEIDFLKSGVVINFKGTGDSLNADTFYGINKFRFELNGETSPEGLINGRYYLSDKYDWDNRHSDAGSLTKGAALDIVCEMLDYMGISNPKEWIKNKMGEDEFHEMSSEGFVTIDDEDGLRLQKKGIGIPFNVVASWDIVNMKLDIPEKLIK